MLFPPFTISQLHIKLKKKKTGQIVENASRICEVVSLSSPYIIHSPTTMFYIVFPLFSL